MKSFTLIELVIVVIIVGILATLGITQYGSYRENVFDHEAQADLRLILAGERIRRMDDSELGGHQYNEYEACADTLAVNTNLELTITITNPAWTYRVVVPYPPGGSMQDFCAEAARNGGDGRRWRILAPSSGSGRSLDPQPELGTCPSGT